mmetsp:Transcript_18707/g.71109  ORF Transcript_18707/g.71109 Transcript_18707/m.71109 type:complete len:201 (+) Transcript_18707:2865-3467(+)
MGAGVRVELAVPQGNVRVLHPLSAVAVPCGRRLGEPAGPHRRVSQATGSVRRDSLRAEGAEPGPASRRVGLGCGVCERALDACRAPARARRRRHGVAPGAGRTRRRGSGWQGGLQGAPVAGAHGPFSVDLAVDLRVPGHEHWRQAGDGRARGNQQEGSPGRLRRGAEGSKAAGRRRAERREQLVARKLGHGRRARQETAE